MAHYAFLDENNVVVEVIVGIDETELIEGKSPEEWYGEFRGMKCVRTSYNAKIRKVFAGQGSTYDSEKDVFYPYKPYPSWILDEEKWQWVAPVAPPENIHDYHWWEEGQSWQPHLILEDNE